MSEGLARYDLLSSIPHMNVVAKDNFATFY